MDEAEFDLDPVRGGSVRKLESLTSEAKAKLGELQADGFCFMDLIPRGTGYFDLLSAKENRIFDVADLYRFIGEDKTAPQGGNTLCDYCLTDRILDKALSDNPGDSLLEDMCRRWCELDAAIGNESHPRKFPSEISKLKKSLDVWFSAISSENLKRVQDIFLAARKSMEADPAFLDTLDKVRFIPRFVTCLHMREEDGPQIGEVRMKNDQPIRMGAFVAVSVEEQTCFNRVVFALGLKPGYHVLAGCGIANHDRSHLGFLQNIRIKPNKNGRSNWRRLYAQTYDLAMNTKILNDENPRNSAGNGAESPVSLRNLWERAANPGKSFGSPELWIIGKELEDKLGDPDRDFRHTVRAIMARKSRFSSEWEILLVVEKGAQKSGGAATRKSGKPPGFGCPGGMVEDNETVGRALVREAENESQTRQISKIVACVLEYEKEKRPDCDRKNVDHWFVVEGDQEAGLSKRLIESDEIHSIRWVPLKDLPAFSFQDTREGRSVWNVQSIVERKLMYPNHAINLIRAIPRIPGVVLPENWTEFKDKLRQFHRNRD